MRAFAERIITEAAVACGLPAEAVFPELENEKKEEIFLPEKRLETAFLEEQLEYQGWRVGRIADADNKKMHTRYSVYRVRQPVRVLVRDTDKNALDAFCREFLKALPSKTRDDAGNGVRIKAQKATRKGYTFGTIKIDEKPIQALHIHFIGIIHRDVAGVAITQITLHPRYEAAYERK